MLNVVDVVVDENSSFSAAFLPAPIVVGHIFDSLCIFWNSKSTCDESSLGNCLLYDVSKLRWSFYGAQAIVRFLSGILDLAVGVVTIMDNRSSFGSCSTKSCTSISKMTRLARINLGFEI